MVGKARPLLDTKKLHPRLVIRHAVVPDDVRFQGWKQHKTNAGNDWNKDLAEDRAKNLLFPVYWCSVLCFSSILEVQRDVA